MNQSSAEQIRQNPKFVELTEKRSKYAWALSAAMLIIYYAFILIIAFDPSLLGRPISQGSVTTIGIPVGIFIIVAAFVLTGLYVRRANSEFDRLNREIIEEIR